ncbi:MAG: DUF2090 domain-containing protein [bacterium]|nr:DUF2090 domain-containing protein [bacterium]
MNDNLGYEKPLFILPFDHRASFFKMLGFGELLTSGEQKQAAEAKWVIYQGLKKAVADGEPPKDQVGVLVEEQFGDAVLRDAAAEGFVTILTVEKSGRDEFDFEYGEKFGEHIEKYRPTFAKALIRYNPEGEEELNKRQRNRLKILSDYCHQRGHKFLIEPLIPATESQLESVHGDRDKYDKEIRYKLMIKMVKELQDDGVEPDVWKIEGLEKAEQYEAVMKQARSGGRDSVKAIVLGRGAEWEQVEKWLRAGAGVDGVIGFAIGRTIFRGPLEGMKNGEIDKEQAAGQIAKNYQHFYEVFKG